MSITLFIRKGTKKQRVRLSARAYYILPSDGAKIDFCVVTNCYVDRDKFNIAMTDAKAMAKFLDTDDGKKFNEFKNEVTSVCDAYVSNGGKDIEHLKKMIAGERIDLPKYFEEWWAYCLEQWEKAESSDFLATNGAHKGGKISPKCLQCYGSHYRTLLSFIADTKRMHLTYGEINQSLVNELDIYLRGKNFAGGSRARIFSAFNLVARKAEKRGLLRITWDSPNINKKRSENVKPVFLTKERLEELCAHVFAGKNMQEAADIFIVGCLTGQRHSDYERITLKDIVVINGVEFIDVTQKKTLRHLYVPCDARVKAILAKYGGALPRMCLTVLNEKIKIVGAEMGWTELVNVDKEEKGMRYVSQMPFYTQIGSHTARRTMLTQMYESGVSLANIMRVSGHTSELMLRKYLCLDDKQDAMELLKSGYFSKEVNNENGI